MARSTEDRVTRLEEVIAHQQQTISDLDEVVRELNAQVTHMAKLVTEVKTIAKDAEMFGSEAANARDEKPPHYGGFGSAAKG